MGYQVPQIKVGNQFPQEQELEQDFDPTRGIIYRYMYECSNSELGKILWEQYVSQGIACRVHFALGKANVYVDDNTQVYTLDSWELRGDDENIDVLMSPLIINDIVDGLVGHPAYTYADVLSNLRQSIANGDEQSQAFAVVPQSYLVGGLTWYMYPFIVAGLSQWRNEAQGDGYVLKHVTNCSSEWTQNIADFGVGYIYSTAQLLTEVTDSSLWANPLSARLQYKIAKLPLPETYPAGPGPSIWRIGWLKGRSTESTSANNRDDITQFYTYGYWAPIYLPLPAT